MGRYQEENVKKAQYIVDAVRAAIERDLAKTKTINREDLSFWADVLEDVERKLKFEKELLDEREE